MTGGYIGQGGRGGNPGDGQASHSGRSRNAASCFMPQKPEILRDKCQLDG